MSDATESWETIAGCKINVLRGGRGAPLLFLHGARRRRMAAVLQGAVGALRGDRTGHPGFGRSDIRWLDNVGDPPISISSSCDWLARDQSIGTRSAAGRADLAVRNNSLRRSRSSPRPAPRQAPKNDLFLWSPEQAVRNLFFDQTWPKPCQSRPDEEERKRQAKNALTLAKLTWQPRLYDPNLRKWLHRIDRPTLIVWGDSDKLIPPVYGPAYRDLIPGAKLEVIKNCGHLPHIEKTGETAAIIVKFIEEAKR